MAGGFFFSADRVSDLARKVVTKYRRISVPPGSLEQTVARYKLFVDIGTDEDFGKPTPLHKIATSPFDAPWTTPVIHDMRSGLRINGNCQVMDMNGQVIAGLHCGGEAVDGISAHGLARASCQSYISGN